MAGYYGSGYDRYSAENSDQSTIYKMKETYWTTKQAVMKKLGKKQDEHIVASDSELDAKLEVFKAIQQSSLELLRVIERYQDCLCILSREENSMGRLLKSESGHDKTRAGKMMAAVGKAQCFSSQQMLGLRAPLVRLYQEVETFRYRAITDTMLTVNRMEVTRTEYRGALMWMKDISENLDPDTSRQLQKFRTVQAQVKKAKLRFDRLKLDVMQKVDLLAASRCNMFSQVLANYQTTLLQFWAKTSTRMTAVAQSFKGYQYFEFNMLKELGEPSKKLSEQTGGNACISEHEIDDDGEMADPPPKSNNSVSKNSKDATKHQSPDSGKTKQVDSLLDAIDREFSSAPAGASSGYHLERSTEGRNEIDTREGAGSEGQSESGPTPSFIDFGDDDEDVDLDEMRRKQDEEYDFTGMMKQSKASAGQSGGGHQTAMTAGGPVDLLGGFENEGEKDDMTFIDDILGGGNALGGYGAAGSTTSNQGDLSQEWTAVFGSDVGVSQLIPFGETDEPSTGNFMPSSLLETSLASGMGSLSMLQPLNASGGVPAGVGSQDKTSSKQPAQTSSNSGPKPKKKAQKQEMSAWYSLFAELDPLANPDAIGRNKDDLTDA